MIGGWHEVETAKVHPVVRLAGRMLNNSFSCPRSPQRSCTTLIYPIQTMLPYFVHSIRGAASVKHGENTQWWCWLITHRTWFIPMFPVPGQRDCSLILPLNVRTQLAHSLTSMEGNTNICLGDILSRSVSNGAFIEFRAIVLCQNSLARLLCHCSYDGNAGDWRGNSAFLAKFNQNYCIQWGMIAVDCI